MNLFPRWLFLLVACGAVLFGAEDEQAATFPAELAGKWMMRQGSGSGYRDPNSGQFSAPNANIFTYTIYPGGRYEHSALLTSSLYQCTMQIFGFETGRAQVSGTTIIFIDQSATLKSRDTCRPQWNYDKAGKLSRLEAGWRIARDQHGLKLILTSPGGKEESYYRQ